MKKNEYLMRRCQTLSALINKMIAVERKIIKEEFGDTKLDFIPIIEENGTFSIAACIHTDDADESVPPIKMTLNHPLLNDAIDEDETLIPSPIEDQLTSPNHKIEILTNIDGRILQIVRGPHFQYTLDMYLQLKSLSEREISELKSHQVKWSK